MGIGIKILRGRPWMRYLPRFTFLVFLCSMVTLSGCSNKGKIRVPLSDSTPPIVTMSVHIPGEEEIVMRSDSDDVIYEAEGDVELSFIAVATDEDGGVKNVGITCTTVRNCCVGNFCEQTAPLVSPIDNPDDAQPGDMARTQRVVTHTSNFAVSPEGCDSYYKRMACDALGENFHGGTSKTAEFTIFYSTTEATTYKGEFPEGQPGVISGRVWHDLCANPIPRDSLPPGSPLPPGCIDFNGNVMANGLLEEMESGIDEVMVRISEGSCPSTDSSTWVSTDEEGNYTQSLTPGTYCVYIDEFEDPNDGRLLPGIWTYPIPEGPAQTTVTVEEEGQIIEEVNFGWDFMHAPEIEAKSSFSGKVWNDLNGDGTLDADELGIEGVEIVQSMGICDEDWQDRQVGKTYTKEDGFYTYSSTGGTWCIVVDPEEEQFNRLHFQQGGWTLPILSEVERVAAFTIALEWDEQLKGVNFGWHYPPYVIADKNVNCRFGPRNVYDVVDYLMEGEKKWLEGRNADNTWWWTEDHCWVADSVVSFYGDPNELPIIAAPPTPTPPQPEDTVPPLVEITHQPPNPDINGLVTFTATASDNVGVARIEIWVKPPGTEVVFNPSKVCENSAICTFIGGTYSEGQGEYYAKAWDEAGNMGISVTHSFIVSPLP